MCQSRHRRGNVLVSATVIVGGSAAAPKLTEVADKAFDILLQSGEATAGYVKVSLAGRADDECGVTAH